jgi:aminobenzoyl-glutamate utilization protein B
MSSQKKIVSTIRYLLLVTVIVSIPFIAFAGTEVKQAKATVIKWVDENATHIADLSRKIWEYPEIGLKEFKSSDLLVSELEANGFKVKRGLAHKQA